MTTGLVAAFPPVPMAPLGSLAGGRPLPWLQLETTSYCVGVGSSSQALGNAVVESPNRGKFRAHRCPSLPDPSSAPGAQGRREPKLPSAATLERGARVSFLRALGQSSRLRCLAMRISRWPCSPRPWTRRGRSPGALRVHRSVCVSVEEFVAHGSTVKCLAIGRKSGRVMVTGGEDNKVNLWAIGKTNCIMVSTVSSLNPPLGYVLRNTKTGVTRTCLQCLSRRCLLIPALLRTIQLCPL
ncbi:hypothetical protein HPB49_020017 [Dermacentor silvarum]|uniref:Uncharacterized protein n=1 Tax=Dermacentor silvarum TaxID=543639 RepID=A0ACB8E2J4_DERSI|nr:hypothetical protein HPB49_020017 [Dermacentor silvarum]